MPPTFTQAPSDPLTIYCPIAASVDRGAPWQEIEAASVAWYASLGLPEPPELIGHIRAALFTHRCYPEANDELLRLLTDAILWTFCYDDHLTSATADEQHTHACLAAASRVFDTIACPIVESCPYVAGLRDVMRRLRAALTAGQWMPAAIGWRSYLMSVVPGRVIATVDDYLSWRHYDDGGIFMGPLCTAAGGYEISPAEWADPRAALVVQAMGCIAGIENDLASPAAEARSAHILDLLACERDITRDAAVGHAIALCDQLQCRLMHHIADLDTTGTPNLARFGHGVAQLIRGNLEWSALTTRYQHRAGTSAPPVTFTLTDVHPDHDCMTRPTYPSVAWWWDV